MNDRQGLTHVPCPLCGSSRHRPWTTERDFTVVRCDECRLLLVNPRPAPRAIDEAVRTGVHGDAAAGLDVTARRVPAKVRYYAARLRSLFDDVWAAGRPVSWLDVGAGYGELLEAVSQLAPAGSRLQGVEPMQPKAAAARARGLDVQADYLQRTHPKVALASFVDVFSHVPDFRAFLEDVRHVLLPGGEIFMETGNLADLDDRHEFPDELGVPDHLVFAGEAQLRRYLADSGFEIVRLERQRVDDAVGFLKCAAKKLLGRPAQLRLPYTSRYRQLLVRARVVSR
jgi:2-polyprenyl-3-methyl-5-hydroxy-6-metoxy-1,4-benzoquinol methylase